MANARLDFKGKQVGWLTGVKPSGRVDNEGVWWVLRCKCGTKVCRPAARLRDRRGRNSGIPASCGCYRRTNRSHLYKGVGDLSATRWQNIRAQAIRKGRVFKIDIKYAWDLFVAQGKKCALSGEPLVMNPTSQVKGASTASLDRKDSRLGYVPGNVQWVHVAINDMKSDWPEDVFVKWCRLVAIVSRGKY